MKPGYAQSTHDGVLLAVHVQPNARRTEVAGIHGEALKIRLHAPPVDGKANAALLTFLAEALGVARSAVEITRGETSRTKQVRVRGISTEDAVARLSHSRPS